MAKMKLKLGKMTSKEVAQWFGISYNTYTHKIPQYLEKLEDYCDFEKIYGGVNIKEIFTEEYDKNLTKRAEDIFLNEIKECIKTQGGLSTISGMARKYKQELGPFSTAKRQLAKAGNKLFGETKSLTSTGEAGSREYVWAIKINDYNRYRYMTEQEEELFDSIIKTFYTKDIEKVKKKALLEKSLIKKEITVDEYVEQQELLGLDTFAACIFNFKDRTGNMIVRCTRHEVEESLKWEDSSDNI